MQNSDFKTLALAVGKTYARRNSSFFFSFLGIVLVVFALGARKVPIGNALPNVLLLVAFVAIGWAAWFRCDRRCPKCGNVSELSIPAGGGIMLHGNSCSLKASTGVWRGLTSQNPHGR